MWNGRCRYELSRPRGGDCGTDAVPETPSPPDGRAAGRGEGGSDAYGVVTWYMSAPPE
jgi:hypothetical protein